MNVTMQQTIPQAAVICILVNGVWLAMFSQPNEPVIFVVTDYGNGRECYNMTEPVDFTRILRILKGYIATADRVQRLSQ